MRWGRTLALLVAAAGMAGCTISREIREVEPPPQPPLQNLEQHLDYTDPDAGKPDYVIDGG